MEDTRITRDLNQFGYTRYTIRTPVYIYTAENTHFKDLWLISRTHRYKVEYRAQPIHQGRRSDGEQLAPGEKICFMKFESDSAVINYMTKILEASKGTGGRREVVL